jgi:hypothetical protein
MVIMQVREKGMRDSRCSLAALQKASMRIGSMIHDYQIIAGLDHISRASSFQRRCRRTRTQYRELHIVFS